MSSLQSNFKSLQRTLTGPLHTDLLIQLHPGDVYAQVDVDIVSAKYGQRGLSKFIT